MGGPIILYIYISYIYMGYIHIWDMGYIYIYMIDTGSIHDFQENIKKVVRSIEHS